MSLLGIFVQGLGRMDSPQHPFVQDLSDLYILAYIKQYKKLSVEIPKGKLCQENYDLN